MSALTSGRGEDTSVLEALTSGDGFVGGHGLVGGAMFWGACNGGRVGGAMLCGACKGGRVAGALL